MNSSKFLILTLVNVILIANVLTIKTIYDKGIMEYLAIQQKQADTVKDLINRITPQYNGLIIPLIEDSDFDFFELSSMNTQGKVYIIIRGNNGVSLASGYGYYLENFLQKSISFTGDNLNNLPDTLPEITNSVIKKRFTQYSYYMNVCTVSYTMVWWTWSRWEKEIDWMAMKGINLPLMFVGQEYVFMETFKYFNVSYEDQAPFYSGPAFLAWNRMGNIKEFAGPLPDYWVQQQFQLGKQMLQRMIDFGMSPVLPAFAGHVPDAFAKAQPQANITKSAPWAGFPDTLTEVSFLDSNDPLYPQVQAKFIQLAIKLYNNTAHIYNGDQFNEMIPGSSDPTYLKASSTAMIKGMLASDPKAVWLMQGWLFVNDPTFWQQEQIQAYLSGVSVENMIILDLWSEEAPIWSKTNNYYGKRWIWCMLHDFGGTMGMYGQMQKIQTIPYQAYQNSSNTMIGIGITMEGINQNYIMYDQVLSLGWNQNQQDLDEWFAQYLLKRYGVDDRNVTSAWNIIKNTIYSPSIDLEYVQKSQTVRYPGFDSIQTLAYNYCDLVPSWEPFYWVNQQIQKTTSYQNDLADLGREILSGLFLSYYKSWIIAYNNFDLKNMKIYADLLLQLLVDIDMIMGTQQIYMLGYWIQQAQVFAQDDEEMIQYKYNAINQLTFWGPTGQINDYASKEWNGLLGYYYYGRYLLFFEEAYTAASQQQQLDYNKFISDCYIFENDFQNNTFDFPSTPVTDVLTATQQLLSKWSGNINKICQQ